MENPTQTITLEDLLQHAGWIRGLATGLVADPAAADDLVQETWLAALKNPPQSGGNLASWLARVLKHTAWQRWRSEGRRDRREQEVAKQESVDLAPDKVLVRFELQHELSSLLSQLEEPYRGVVLLRYFDGLSSAQIARRLALPAGTVRWRLKVGLDKLRIKLDAAHGDRSTWRALFVPLLQPPLPATPPNAGHSFPVVQAVLAMGLTTKVAVVSTLVSVAMLGLWFSEQVSTRSIGGLVPQGRVIEAEFSHGTPARNAARSEAENSGERAVVELAMRAPETVQAEEDPPLDYGTLRARFVDKDGLPVSGVQAWPDLRPWNRVQVMSKEDTSSDADGQLEIHLIRTNQWNPTFDAGQLIAKKQGYAHGILPALVQPGERVDLGVVTLQPGGALSGRVLDVNGQPVPDAWVGTVKALPRADLLEGSRKTRREYRGSLNQTRSGPDGRFRLEGLTLGYVHLFAAAEDWLGTYSPGVLVEFGEERHGVELVLEPLGLDHTIEGRVLDPSGNPLPLALVSATFSDMPGGFPNFLRADEEGAFRLVLERSTQHDLIVSHTDYGMVALEQVSPGTHNLKIRMEPGRYLELKVTGSAGQPIEGLRVKRVIPGFYDFLMSKVDFAGDTARIAIPVQRFLLEVSADGCDLIELGPFDPDTAPAQLTCNLDALPGIDGVVLAGGKPLPGALVSAYFPPQFYAQWHGLPSRLGYKAITSGVSDGEGRFKLSVRETGDLVLMVSADGYAPLEHGPIAYDPRTGADSLELRLAAGGAIRGKVLSRSGGTAAGAIVAVNRGDNHARTQRADDQGGFFFEHLTPGPWEVSLVENEISAADMSHMMEDLNVGLHAGLDERPRAQFSGNCIVEEGQTTLIELDREKSIGPRVFGQIMVNGKAPGAWSVALGASSSMGVLASNLAVTVLEPSGAFEFEAPGPGTWQLVLTSPGPLAVHYVQTVEVNAEGFEWNLALETGSLPLDSPVSGAQSGANPSQAVRQLLLWDLGDRVAVCQLGAADPSGLVLSQAPVGLAKWLRVPLTGKGMKFSELLEWKPSATAQVPGIQSGALFKGWR